MKAVNLLPPEYRGSRGPQRSSSVRPFVREPLLLAGVGLAVAVTAAVGFVAHSSGSTVSARQDTIRQLDAQLAKLAAEHPSTSVNDAALRLTTLTGLAGQRTSWDGFLGSLSRVVPEDVWLLNLSAQASSGGTPTGSTPSTATSSAPSTSAPSAVTLTGYTYSQPSVARMMRRLDLVPWLQDVSLVTSTKSSISDHTVYQFTLGANFIPIPEAGT
jgi:Tfp pilus assembly protein PilN